MTIDRSELWYYFSPLQFVTPFSNNDILLQFEDICNKIV